jgi:hypothetical protein
VIDVPGERPTSPCTTETPVFVTVWPPSTAKLVASPRSISPTARAEGAVERASAAATPRTTAPASTGRAEKRGREEVERAMRRLTEKRRHLISA